MSISLPVHNESNCRWFAVDSCVLYDTDNAAQVFVGGKLVGAFGPKDILARNLLLFGLSQEKKFKKGKLAWAFKLSYEQLLRVRRHIMAHGLDAVPARPRGGSEPKVTDDIREKLYGLFAEGFTAQTAYSRVGRRYGLSYSSVARVRRAWKRQLRSRERNGDNSAEARNPSATEAPVAETTEGLGLPSNEPKEEGLEDEDVAAASLRSGKQVQHLGGLLLVAMIASFGLYDAALKGWTASAHWRDLLRMAFDAVILALGLSQKCVEGVRRLETSTAPLLLRTNRAPSESWVRRILKRYVDGTGMAVKLHLRMTGVYLDAVRETEADEPVVFYVDNHMRPYTGKYTLRKGWRMQDKRAVPGVTDYYVHDEDGRPVCRVDAPGHDSLTDFLIPIAELLRGGLEAGQRILLAFDRAGAFPGQMAALRDSDVEFVTYERRPYQLLPRSAFMEKLELEGGEEVWIHEKRLKNLGKGRGRVRRISILTEEGNQVNVLAVSKEPAWRLVEIIIGRWVQENGFKHGKERWGLNQLDRRKRLPFAPGTVIPNPTRRRLEFSIRISQEREGKLRNKLARLENGTPEHTAVESKLEEQLRLQAELMAQRPSLPKHAPVEETELSGELTYHEPHYKTVLDTIRIACLNAEAELAGELSEHMKKPAEAKKLLANLFAAPGDLRVGKKSATLHLKFAARANERRAVAELFKIINNRNLTLPGDPKSRPLRFKSDI
jgi:hypothetical protein